MSRSMGLENELDRLFGLPLGDFTRARDDLVERLKADRATEEAEAVGALRKPTVPVWTINQLSRLDRAGIRALLDAGNELRASQQRLLRGDDAGDALREAAARERRAVERLTDRARAVLEDAKRPATAKVLDRIGTTLRAAAVTDDGRTLLESGRLTAELDPPGFDAFGAAGTQAAPRRKPAPKGDELAERRRQHEERQRRRRELQAAARAADRSAREAEREAERAEAAAAKARRVAGQARANADAAAAALTDA
ncbi:MAG: hypothetical protein ACM3QU_06010 [Verrucomicrobiota bacterium]